MSGASGEAPTSTEVPIGGTPKSGDTSLPGGAVLAASRRLIVVCLISGFVYTMLTTGSRGGPADIGRPSGTESVALTLQPSFAVYVALALTYLIATRRVLRRITDESAAVRVFARASIVAAAIALGSAAIGDLWFFTAPLGGWPHPGFWIAPFPFASQSVDTSVTG